MRGRVRSKALYSAPAVLLAAAFSAPTVACVEAVPLEDYPDPIEVREVDPNGALGPEVIGRVDNRTPGQWRMSWPGIRIIARFRGTAVNADFDEIGLPDGINTDPVEKILPTDSIAEQERKKTINAPDLFSQYDVIVDGQVTNILKLRGVSNGSDQIELTSVTNQVRLAENLDPNLDHTIELVRRSESSVGISTFKGFSFTGGPTAGYLPGFRAHRHRLLFAGDSITAGYGNEGDGFLCKFSPETSNARLSWASVAGRYLQASSTLVAWSGKGMAINFRTDPAKPLYTLPELFDATVALDVPFGAGGCDATAPADGLRPCFDPKTFAPDVIVVNLGTNDSNQSYCPNNAGDCDEAVRLQRSRDPDFASTKACATAFASCSDAACGTNVDTCVTPALCVEDATRCLTARPPTDTGMYLDKYTSFIKKLRRDYGPSPLIVAVLGPMLSNFASGDGPEGIKTTMANYIRTAVATSGETNVDYLQLDTHYFIETSGCDYHPSAITDRVMAKRLETLVRKRIPNW